MATPFRDSLPTRRYPWITLLLVVINCAVFLFVQPSAFQSGGGSSSSDLKIQQQQDEGERFLMTWAMVPCEVLSSHPVSEKPDRCDLTKEDLAQPHNLPAKKLVLLPLLTSMFLHANLLHLAGNMLFLWVFGRNVEDRVGKPFFVALYLLGGLAAGLTSVFFSMSSASPHLGASGAIAAVMGAYLVFYPREKILTAIAIPPQIVYVPSVVVLLMFFVTQFFTGKDSGVAWEAHAGGMVAGAVLALLLLPVPAVKRLARKPVKHHVF